MLKRKPVRILAWQLLLSMFLFLYLDVDAAPVASFTANQTTGCTPFSVIFTSTSSGAVSYYWDLGNGNTSTLANPSNLFTSPGNYSIKLIAYDAAGNSDTALYTNYITVVQKPSADFHVNITVACPDNNSFIFTNTSTGATTYLWDFGDGNTSSQDNPIHSYTHAGIFTVTLIAMNAYGCQDVKIINQYITVNPKPDATVTVDDSASCDPATIFHFSNNAQNATSWNWDFGDFSSSPAHNPTHSFPGPGSYPVSVIVTNNFGCIDTSEAPIVISIGLNNWATFTQNIDSGCAALNVQFINTNTNVATSFWSFGDGSTSSQNNPSHIYTNGGIYSVSLIVTSSDGCADTVVKNSLIHVGIIPSINFTNSNPAGCAPLSVHFTNTSANYDSCTWYFGDGTTSNAINPTHVYTNGGVYSVILQCWGPTGCSNTLVRHNLITITTPRALFAATPRVGCPPLPTTFTSIAQSSGLNYLWNFGDGSTSTLANPTHTYNQSANFDVTLIVIDSLGCRDTIAKPNFIQTLNPAANYIPPPTTSGCAPLTAQFTDGTVGSVSWHWSFGDGSTSNLQNPTHVYTTPGLYTVSLTTSSAGGGCSQTISNFSTFDVNGGYAGFTHTNSTCPPYVATFQDTSLNAVSWLWDFGDGTTSTAQNPTHIYARAGYHSVSLNIITADGCSYTTMQSNIVYFSPFGAHFYGIPLSPAIPSPVQFYANSIGATSWLWDFGDSTSSTLENPLHNFLTARAYAVTLTISNGVCTLFYNPPPFFFGTPDTTAVDRGEDYIIGIQQGCTPLNVLFTNRVPDAATWLWDFGDGTTSNLEFPSHVYNATGIYSVTLTTSDTLGIVQVLRLDSVVHAGGPETGFLVNQTATCSSTQISVTDTSKNAFSWRWSFGDGTIDTTQNPLHIYTASQPNYIITQTVTDTMGCSASISTSIFSNFVSPLLASESEVCGYDSVHFFTSLQNFASYLWNFGDGDTSTLTNPSHLYMMEGIYFPSLTVTDISGCAQTFTIGQAVKVKLPIANFMTAGPTHGCDTLGVSFINTSLNADTYLWDLGDGNASTYMNPVHKYTQVGVFDVSLTVYRGACLDTIRFPQYIRVDTAHADFEFTSDQICLPVTSTFHDLSTNPVSWKWYFGDNDSSMVQNPVHTYTNFPYYFPGLVMTDIHGCVDTMFWSSFPTLNAGFTTSADSGCFPMTVQFTNKSGLLVDRWYWDFGDGTTSTLSSPLHTYSQPGIYDVMLVVKSVWATCSDTLFIPQKIKVRQPHADFFSASVPACAPSLVNFTDQSVDADTYLWDFGDGSTSTNVNPVHIYNTPGNYTVKLVTSSNLGCADSLSRPEYIHVLGPITNFNASAFEGCVPFEVEFTDHSINASVYSWNFGDGYDEFSTDPVHVFQDTGSFIVSLVTQDTTGCISYFELPQPVLVHPSPVAAFTPGSPSGCQPFSTTFTNTSTGNQFTYWEFGDGDTTSIISPSHDYLLPGSYDVRLITLNQFGCTDTATLNQPLEVYATPQPQFYVNDAVGCIPFHVTFINNSTNLDGPQYLWDFGNGFTSTDPNPFFDFTNPGSYTIGLTITNASGCSSSISYPSLLHVPDTIPPNETNILSVSVMSNTSVRIIWENNPAIDLASYIIYRSDGQMNFYRPVYTETNVQNTNFSLTSEYVDNGLNTLQYTYSYKIQALDTCGSAIPVDQLKAHTTINVSSQQSGRNILVSWTPYGGCPVSSYQLYRATPGNEFDYLATLPPDSLDYIDSTFSCPYAFSYKVMATDLCGNVYTSYSDTSVTTPLNILSGQVVDVVRSTVVDNQSVLTEWVQPLVHPEMVAQFDVYRSTDNSNFYYIKSVPSVQTDFMDYNVDVQNEHYFYKILVVNTCDIGEDLSGITSTIILKGEMNDARQIHLGWTPYEGWENGVEYYVIEMQDENGNWQLLHQVDGNTLIYDYQE